MRRRGRGIVGHLDGLRDLESLGFDFRMGDKAATERRNLGCKKLYMLRVMVYKAATGNFQPTTFREVELIVRVPKDKKTKSVRNVMLLTYMKGRSHLAWTQFCQTIMGCDMTDFPDFVILMSVRNRRQSKV